MSAPCRFTGLVAATFTPMHADGSLALDRVPAIVDHLLGQGLAALFVGGSTGEGPSLSIRERMDLAEAYVEAVAGRLPVIIHVGHNSLHDAGGLAAHADRIGAAAIAAAPPAYYPIPTVEALADCLETIARHAPTRPLYYYHIPRLTAVALDMLRLLELGRDRLPSFAGIKFSAFTFDVLQRCVDEHGDRYNLLFGSDEMLLYGLVAGADGAVGSTYNFLGRLYNEVIECFRGGDLDAARERQGRAVRIVHALLEHPVHPALKATMGAAGVDCGPPRLPLEPLDAAARERLERTLRDAGFFEWA
ncbi:MAG: dihydrodipicolinate synthase family protein [Planctomycetota bacterium]|jgi:N-acetylneuraminate lyase